MSPVFQEQLARLPDLLGAHIILTLVALAVGIAISLPAALLAVRMRSLQGPLLAVASVIQTVPSLAVLALMVAAFGLFGQPAALIALTAYSILPILRNTIAGIEGVDRAVVEAARGIGMSERQILWGVELPLAAPIIIAGIRTATVWVVGIATLATPVGADSLGSYIFSGLQTRNPTAVLFGVVAAAALALALDGLIRLGEVAAARRSKGLGIAAGLGLAIIIVGSLLSGGRPAPPPAPPSTGDELVQVAAEAPRRPLVIGAKTFTEQFVLARALERALEQAGYPVSRKEGLGSSVVFDALAQGEIDVYVDYSGTIWTNHMKRTEMASRQEVLDQMGRWLKTEHGIVSMGSLGFENTYALAMTDARAESLGIATIEDLAPNAPSLSIGGDYEFFGRPEWRRLRDTYGLAFAAERSFDATLMYPAVVEGDVEVITAFSSDGRIAAFDLRVLADTKQAFPPYDAVLLLSRDAAGDARVVEALRPFIGAIDATEMRAANKLVDVDEKSVDTAATFVLEALK
ncbi:ABC transporter permease/substrate-binding protein [Haliangium sp.]|uniref:ABC transporter permease/substrate-binding protein n=1 Tax=Haliangium sp. TaxID=2663208 RepID=UPI003D127D82